jgi:hypothetical protein
VITPEKIEMVRSLFPVLAIVVALPVTGWVITTWLRIKNGYPLDGAWGQAVYPKTTSQELERIKLLTQENAQLHAEIGSLKDRLGNVERIVTDSGYHLTHKIEALREH